MHRDVTSSGAPWVLRVGAAKLDHETGDDSMEMKTIVEAGLGEVDEVGRSYRHLNEA